MEDVLDLNPLSDSLMAFNMMLSYIPVTHMIEPHIQSMLTAEHNNGCLEKCHREYLIQ